MTQLMIIKGGEVGKKGDEGGRAVSFVSQHAINDVLLCLCLLISSLKSWPLAKRPLAKNWEFCWSCWCMPVVSAHVEAEADGSL